MNGAIPEHTIKEKQENRFSLDSSIAIWRIIILILNINKQDI